MALSSVLLCVVFCGLQQCWTRPLDFACSPEARKSINIMKVLEKAMDSCTGSDQLQHCIQLPCIRIHKASWDKKSLQQKLSSVCAALGVLLQGLRSVRDHSHLPCQTSILRRLDHNMQNHRHILSSLDNTKTSTCSQSTPEQQDTDCTSLSQSKTKSLSQTLKHYGKLLSGPLELLLVEFSPNCTQHPSGST
ncbi:uncharacterized protein LOC143500333 [Brachyhypopomus gauderio]|uniref:uncharacterized protein LOC143500333 n=1 Tax=Brachyhypopomus gauderio TaxID=698409 RepID=UPI0040430528